jgi:D-3-phosphoglycerate dehydrogenase
MKIAVLDDFQGAFATVSASLRLQGHEVVAFHDALAEPSALAARLDGFEAVLLTQQRTGLSRDTVARLKTLRFVSQTGRHFEHLDLDALTEAGIVVSAAGGGSPTHTSELTWALILASRRHIPQEVAALKAGVWQTTVGDGLAGRTLGIYAYGKIGGMVAEVGRAFGMRVVCWGREGSMARAAEAGFDLATSRESFFAESDIVSLHIPLKPETRGIITPADLALMQPDALIVNTSRAGIIAKGALVAALRQGRPGRAAIDVFDEEPAKLGREPLLEMPNVLCTPHLGYVERDGYERIYKIAVDQLLAFAAGAPINVINPEATHIAARRAV